MALAPKGATFQPPRLLANRNSLINAKSQQKIEQRQQHAPIRLKSVSKLGKTQLASPKRVLFILLSERESRAYLEYTRQFLYSRNKRIIMIKSLAEYYHYCYVEEEGANCLLVGQTVAIKQLHKFKHLTCVYVLCEEPSLCHQLVRGNISTATVDPGELDRMLSDHGFSRKEVHDYQSPVRWGEFVQQQGQDGAEENFSLFSELVKNVKEEPQPSFRGPQQQPEEGRTLSKQAPVLDRMSQLSLKAESNVKSQLRKEQGQERQVEQQVREALQKPAAEEQRKNKVRKIRPHKVSRFTEQHVVQTNQIEADRGTVVPTQNQEAQEQPATLNNNNQEAVVQTAVIRSQIRNIQQSRQINIHNDQEPMGAAEVGLKSISNKLVQQKIQQIQSRQFIKQQVEGASYGAPEAILQHNKLVTPEIIFLPTEIAPSSSPRQPIRLRLPKLEKAEPYEHPSLAERATQNSSNNVRHASFTHSELIRPPQRPIPEVQQLVNLHYTPVANSSQTLGSARPGGTGYRLPFNQSDYDRYFENGVAIYRQKKNLAMTNQGQGTAGQMKTRTQQYSPTHEGRRMFSTYEFVMQRGDSSPAKSKETPSKAAEQIRPKVLDSALESQCNRSSQLLDKVGTEYSALYLLCCKLPAELVAKIYEQSGPQDGIQTVTSEAKAREIVSKQKQNYDLILLFVEQYFTDTLTSNIQGAYQIVYRPSHPNSLISNKRITLRSTFELEGILSTLQQAKLSEKIKRAAPKHIYYKDFNKPILKLARILKKHYPSTKTVKYFSLEELPVCDPTVPGPELVVFDESLIGQTLSHCEREEARGGKILRICVPKTREAICSCQDLPGASKIIWLTDAELDDPDFIVRSIQGRVAKL